MYCNACGKDIAQDVHFCPYCGKAVGIPPAPRSAAKRLTRSRADKKIAGVCAGLALYFDLDVSLVRILCIFLTLATGACPGIVTYLLAWIIIPSEPELKPLFATQQPVAG
jgi:phage shock protein C